MKLLDIHLEGMDDSGEKLKRIIDENILCAISICPETLRERGIYSKQYPYLPKRLDLIGEVVSKSGNILGQQGNMHKCKYSHRFADPWHENYCLYNKSLSEDEQRDLMEKGRETLIKLLGKTPELYAPPNHMFDLTTLKVAIDMGYGYFAERGIKVDMPYKLGNGRLIVLPETKFSEKGDIKYIHYDGIEKNKRYFEEIIRNLEPFSKTIKIEEASPEARTENLVAIRKKKFLRDVIKFPERILTK